MAVASIINETVRHGGGLGDMALGKDVIIDLLDTPEIFVFPLQTTPKKGI